MEHGAGRKPGSVPALRPVVIIPLGPRLPGASCDLPGSSGGPPLTLPYLVLLQVGFS